MTIGYVAWGISCETYDICEGAGGHRNSRVFSLQNTYAEVATLAICFARSSGCPREARVSRTSAGRLAANARGVAFGRPKNATKSAGTGPGTCQRREIDQRRRQDLQRPSGDDLPRHRGIGALCYFSVPLSRTGQNQREAQKHKFQGEMFIAEFPGSPGVAFLEFFQIEKFSGLPKGIIRIRLPDIKGPAL